MLLTPGINFLSSNVDNAEKPQKTAVEMVHRSPALPRNKVFNPLWHHCGLSVLYEMVWVHISPVHVLLLKPRNPVSNTQPGPAVVTADVQWPTFNTAYVAFLAALCLNGRICNKRSIYGSLLLQGSFSVVQIYNDKMLCWVQWGLQKSVPLFM